jgi:ferredoxin, 2Fe-2S
MPKISFVKPALQPFAAPEGTILMAALLEQKIPVASSCLGEGVCSKCRVKVVSGAENLSPETEKEKTLRARNKIPDGFRISCQTTLQGDVTLDTAYW